MLPFSRQTRYEITLMPRARLIVILSVATLLAGGAWFFFGRDDGPRYRGKSVSYWFKQYYQPSGPPDRANRRSDRAEKALLLMDTNAVPYLLKVAMAPARDTALRRKYRESLRNLPDSWGLPAYRSPEEIRGEAVELLGEIQPPVGLVLPRLRPALTDPNSPQYALALEVLIGTGPGRETLAPYFVRALHATDDECRWDALRFLRTLGPAAAAAAVPDLIHLLQSAQGIYNLEPLTAAILGDLGSNAAPALPALKHVYETENNADWRCMFAAALFKIAPEQTEPLTFLVRSLTNQPDPAGQASPVPTLFRNGLPLPEPGLSSDEESSPARELCALGQRARAAIPALLEAAQTTNAAVWPEALLCLGALGAPPELVLPRLRARLSSDDASERVWAAGHILRLVPADTQAQSVLVDEIRRHSVHDYPTVCWLALAGTNAQAAAPLLLQALGGDNECASSEILDALRKVSLSADAYLSTLKAELKSRRHPVPFDVAKAILRVAPTDPDAQAVLADYIKTRSEYELDAIDLFGELGPEARAALPLLRHELKRRDRDVREAAAEAIEAIENPAGPASKPEP